jgi:hypothetical protein
VAGIASRVGDIPLWNSAIHIDGTLVQNFNQQRRRTNTFESETIFRLDFIHHAESSAV